MVWAKYAHQSRGVHRNRPEEVREGGKKGEKKKGKGKGRKMMNDNVAQLATGSKSFKSKMNGMQAIDNSVEQAKHVAFEQTKLQYADSTRTDGGGKAISS